MTEREDQSSDSDDESDPGFADSDLDDDHELPTKEWKFKDPNDLAAFSGIIGRLHTYTSTSFAQKVSEGLMTSLPRVQEGSWESWKWPIEDDDTAPKATDMYILSEALRQSLWEHWLRSRPLPLQREGTAPGQAPLSMSSGPSNSVGLTEEMEGPISTAATSFVNDWKNE